MALGAASGPLKALTNLVREVTLSDDEIDGTARRGSKVPEGGDGP